MTLRANPSVTPPSAATSSVNRISADKPPAYEAETPSFSRPVGQFSGLSPNSASGARTSSSMAPQKQVVRRTPSFLKSHDSEVVENTLCVRKGEGGTNDPTSDYIFNANDEATKKAIRDAQAARDYAKELLSQSQLSSSSSVQKRAFEDEAVSVLKKTDRMLRDNFGRMVFRENKDLFGTGFDILNLQHGVVERLLKIPHVVRNEPYSYMKGGMLDFWNPGPRRRVSGRSNNNYDLKPQLKLSAQESEKIAETVQKSLHFAAEIPNPEHQRQLVLAAMMLDSWRRHCSASSFRPLSRMGIELSGITRNFCQEAEDFAKELSKVPGREALANIAQDVRAELDMEMEHWRDGRFEKTFGPKTFSLY